MAYSTDIEAAKALATQAHEGQTDKAGLPYITHPERVAARLDTPEAKVVGWLHDTVEDTPLTVHDIEAAFGPETAAAVDAISRREDEAWSDYLDRVAANPICPSGEDQRPDRQQQPEQDSTCHAQGRRTSEEIQQGAEKDAGGMIIEG